MEIKLSIFIKDGIIFLQDGNYVSECFPSREIKVVEIVVIITRMDIKCSLFLKDGNQVFNLPEGWKKKIFPKDRN